jgi:2-succinyl-5-enolpyruvyl-6-hydroxy-3-cyclohexene-1-carboxylate synthase
MSVSNLGWTRNTVLVLTKLGVEHVCISPGSRNTPLTIAFIENEFITCHSIIDERSSGFFALGIAKTSQKPVVILTTSGTATANLYPAIIEANLSRVPLLVLTADRPPYLIGTGANQTIDQQDLFGHHVRGFIDMGLPNYLERLILVLKKSFLLSLGISHYGKKNNPAGPVHLNFPFDEPLINKEDLKKPIEVNSLMFKRLQIGRIEIEKPTDSIPKFLFDSIKNDNKIIIVCGEGLTLEEKEHLINLAENWNIPIFADCLSGIRFGFNSKYIFSHYHFYLNKMTIPELVIRFGKKPNSKKLNEFLNIHQKKVILFDPVGRFNDDVGQIHSYSVLQIPIIQIHPKNSEYINEVTKLETAFINEFDTEKNKFIEKNIFRFLFDKLPNESYLFIGNSMPIRNIDNFVTTHPKKILTIGNRGASGIDGVISSALGMALLNTDSHNILIIGDVSFAHDLSALQIAKQNDIPLTIIVINNSGGQIFNKFPYAEFGIKDFEKFWITNPELNIKKTADLFGFEYLRIENLDEFEERTFKNQHIIEIVLA